MRIRQRLFRFNHRRGRSPQLAFRSRYKPCASSSARQISRACKAFSASGPTAVTTMSVPDRISAVMISIMLAAEQRRPFASIVISLLKRIAQRTIALVGRACRPLGLVTFKVRVTAVMTGGSFLIFMTETAGLDVVRRGVRKFVLADFLDLEHVRVLAAHFQETIAVTLLG